MFKNIPNKIYGRQPLKSFKRNGKQLLADTPTLFISSIIFEKSRLSALPKITRAHLAKYFIISVSQNGLVNVQWYAALHCILEFLDTRSCALLLSSSLKQDQKKP